MPDDSSHMAREAFSDPVTGSSPVPAMSGVKARTSNASGDPGGYRRHAGGEGQHGAGAGQLDGDPAGSVVGPLGIHDVLALDAECGGDLLEQDLVHGSRADQRGRLEGQVAVRNPADGHQADRALLNDHVLPGRRPAGLKPGMR